MTTIATETNAEGGVAGGDGGAVYTRDRSQTVFKRRCTMHGNSASDSGGGVFNGGNMEFYTSAAFWGNEAMVSRLATFFFVFV